jgi:hypothetical protein
MQIKLRIIDKMKITNSYKNTLEFAEIIYSDLHLIKDRN